MKIVRRKGIIYGMRVSPKWGNKSKRHRYKEKPEYIHAEKIDINHPQWPEYIKLIKQRQEIDINRRKGYLSVLGYQIASEALNEKMRKLLTKN